MNWLIPLVSDSDSIGHVLLVYALVISIGMALGRIKVFGISLGVTFVLFVGLAVSYLGVSVNATTMNFLRDFGLILFVFSLVCRSVQAFLPLLRAEAFSSTS